MIDRQPVVSVVLPFMNAGRWIDQALDSLQRQTWQDFEIIAINDGSTDDGAERVARAARQGLRVRLLQHEKNRGIVASLNAGLDAARGRFIARMDADDICLPHRLERQVAYLEHNGTDLCGSWFVEFGQGLARTVRWPHSEAAVHAAMLFQNTLCHPTVMARRALFESLRYREGYRLAEDYDLFARASASFRMANVPEVLLRYRRHKRQATQADRNPMEDVTRRIRLETLQARGIEASCDEQRLHNLIRAPSSITSVDDLEGIEHWLLKLIDAHQHPDARHIVASQWTRAAIRAAPLGSNMWTIYRRSALRSHLHPSLARDIDLAVLAILRLDYSSRPFHFLRRLGISA